MAILGPRCLDLGDVQLDDDEPQGLSFVDDGPREVVRQGVVRREIESKKVIEIEEAEDLKRHVSFPF